MREALHRLTRHLTPDEVEALLACAATVHVGPGELVVRDGQPNDALHVVIEGSFSVDAAVDGQAVHLADKGPGETFGELSLLTGSPANADVSARGEGLLLRLGRDDLAALRRRSATAEIALVRALTEDLAERVRASSTSLRQEGGRLQRVRGALGRLLGGRAE